MRTSESEHSRRVLKGLAPRWFGICHMSALRAIGGRWPAAWSRRQRLHGAVEVVTGDCGLFTRCAAFILPCQGLRWPGLASPAMTKTVCQIRHRYWIWSKPLPALCNRHQELAAAVTA